jgi:hypothetical protein
MVRLSASIVPLIVRHVFSGSSVLNEQLMGLVFTGMGIVGMDLGQDFN